MPGIQARRSSFELRVGAARDAFALAEGWATHIVSILDPGGVPLGLVAPQILVLHFEDSNRGDPNGPKIEHVEKALAFTRDLAADDRLLVHCVEGLSRSTAIALAALVQAGREAGVAVGMVEEMRPDMWPNECICRHADRLLGTDDAITNAVRARQARQRTRLEESHA